MARYLVYCDSLDALVFLMFGAGVRYLSLSMYESMGKTQSSVWKDGLNAITYMRTGAKRNPV